MARMGWDVSGVILKRRGRFPKQKQGPWLSVMVHGHQAMGFEGPQVQGWKVSPYSFLRTLKPADVIFLSVVDTTGHLDPDQVLPCRHGEGSGKFSVAVSQPDGLFSSHTCVTSSPSVLAEAGVLPWLQQLPPTSGPHQFSVA